MGLATCQSGALVQFSFLPSDPLGQPNSQGLWGPSELLRTAFGSVSEAPGESILAELHEGLEDGSETGRS